MKILILAWFLVGCAAPVMPRPIAQKNGKDLYEASCRHMGDCYKRASRVCNGNFDIETSDATNRGYIHMGMGMVGSVNEKSILYSCGSRKVTTETKTEVIEN